MLFPSEVFLWVFLPLVLIIYYLIPKKVIVARNIFLLVASLFFYAWGEPVYVMLMLAVVIIDYLAGIVIGRLKETKSGLVLQRAVLVAAVLINIGLLGYYKYSNFAVLQINRFAHTNLRVPEVVLPIGISFFIFQALSYVFDVYMGKVRMQKNPLYLGLYISFFPQLIAGPIVRYETVAAQITDRRENWKDFSEGVVRFMTGLMKKVIIANNMAIVADVAFSMIVDNIYAGSVAMAWLGGISYSLQIFFDFSGYSDMAIGLGKMFGFSFPENFNYPYIARSITDFWRRWHISLSGWFRDYVYIPLGGNRVGKVRLIFNLFVVWTLTGIWHGANWTFIAWGLMYFALLTAEKLLRPVGVRVFQGKEKLAMVLGRIYTLLFVMIAWVIFRADNTGVAVRYLKGMFGMGSGSLWDASVGAYLSQWGFFYVLAIFGSMPIVPKLKARYGEKLWWNIASGMMLVVGTVIALTYIVNSAYSPFIYFNF